MLLVHERFIEHKLKQFVDLCSVSNVSVDSQSVHTCVRMYLVGGVSALCQFRRVLVSHLSHLYR